MASAGFGAAGSTGGCQCSPGEYGGPPFGILRHALTGQRRVRITFPVGAVVQWYVVFVAFAHLLLSARAFPAESHGEVASPADVCEAGILWYPAVQVTGRLRWGNHFSDGAALLLGGQVSRSARRRHIEVQVEGQETHPCSPVWCFGWVSCSAPWRPATLREQGKDLLEVGLIGPCATCPRLTRLAIRDGTVGVPVQAADVLSSSGGVRSVDQYALHRFILQLCS